jgi:hypothetical protein
LVVEAAFQHKVWAPSLAKLKDVARLRIVICTLAPELARARFLKRGLADPLREHYHGDRVLALTREGAEPPLETYVPPALEAPTLHIDTADGYQPTVDELIAFILRGE